jgi:hypothetical protein
MPLDAPVTTTTLDAVTLDAVTLDAVTLDAVTLDVMPSPVPTVTGSTRRI